MQVQEAEIAQNNQTPCVYRKNQVYIWAIAPIGSYKSPHVCVSLCAPSDVKQVKDIHCKWVPLEEVEACVQVA